MRNPQEAAAETRRPKTGRALFAWTMEQEQRYEVGLLRYLNRWARLRGFPERMVEWDTDQVEQAHAEATRNLQAIARRFQQACAS